MRKWLRQIRKYELILCFNCLIIILFSDSSNREEEVSFSILFWNRSISTLCWLTNFSLSDFSSLFSIRMATHLESWSLSSWFYKQFNTEIKFIILLVSLRLSSVEARKSFFRKLLFVSGNLPLNLQVKLRAFLYYCELENGWCVG